MSLSDGMMSRLREAAAWPELDQRYTITGLSGQGGMSFVYTAHDRVLDRQVAVKVLDVADRSGARAARILREAHILGRLDHPGILPVYDAGTLPDGRAFYVMKLVSGQRIDRALEARDLADRLTMFGRVLDAVAFAHSLGIVHRDLKPENILAGAFGEVYVIDWGVALTMPLSPTAAGAGEQVIAGTPGFMPPEQEQSPEVDARADVFALGAVLQTLLPASEPPRALTAIALKAQARDIEARYQNVGELAADLARFRDHEPVTAHAETVGERLLRVYRRYEVGIVLVFAYILMRAVLLIWERV